VAQESRIFMFLNTRKDKAELPKEDVDKLMSGHMANIEKMAKEGKLIAAGPFEGGGGIFIFNATSNDEVTEWLKGDPAVQANRWRLEMFPYTSRVGSVCKVSEPYEMTFYTFLRYTPEIGKAEIEQAPELFKQHDTYLKKTDPSATLITEGIFGPLDGGILVFKGEVNKAWVEADPAVRAGILMVDYKKLYIAKGAFCEK
jgi:Uncharacterized protein conserved in bacteria